MRCELCPLQDYCLALREAKIDNDNSYHRQEVVRVDEWDEPSCPLYELIKPPDKEEK